MLHLFSTRMDQWRYGAEHYRLRSDETSTLLLELFKRYHLEATLMPDALELFAREKKREIVNEMSPAELLATISPATRAELLTQLLKEFGSPPSPAGSQPGSVKESTVDEA